MTRWSMKQTTTKTSPNHACGILCLNYFLYTQQVCIYSYNWWSSLINPSSMLCLLKSLDLGTRPLEGGKPPNWACWSRQKRSPLAHPGKSSRPSVPVSARRSRCDLICPDKGTLGFWRDNGQILYAKSHGLNENRNFEMIACLVYLLKPSGGQILRNLKTLDPKESIGWQSWCPGGSWNTLRSGWVESPLKFVICYLFEHKNLTPCLQMVFHLELFSGFLQVHPLSKWLVTRQIGWNGCNLSTV